MQLQQWLKKQSMPIMVFAERVGAHRSSIYRFIKGQTLPRREVLRRIAEVTRGQVTANDFVEPEVDSVDLHASMSAAPEPKRKAEAR